MTWERVLGGGFLRLTFRNIMRAPDGSERVFEGHAYYRAQAYLRWTGTWFDSRGLALPVTARVTDEAVESAWGAADTEQGQTIYRLQNATTLEVIDSVRAKDGQLRQFGKSLLTRQP